jgi:cinnamoyl-CoA reductase
MNCICENRCKDEKSPPNKGFRFNNQRLKDIGIDFAPMSECLYETVKSLQEKQILPVVL